MKNPKSRPRGKNITKEVVNPLSYPKIIAAKKAAKKAAQKAAQKAEKNKFEKIKNLVKEHKSNIPSVLNEVNKMNENIKKYYLSNRNGKKYSTNEIRQKDEELREMDFKYNLQKLGKFFNTRVVKKILELTGLSFISIDEKQKIQYEQGLTVEQKENPWVSPYKEIKLNNYNKRMIDELIKSTMLSINEINLLLKLSMLSDLSTTDKDILKKKYTQRQINDFYKKLKNSRKRLDQYKNEFMTHLTDIKTTIDIKENNNSEKSTNKSVIDYEWNLKNRFLDKGLFITIVFFYCKCVSDYWGSRVYITDQIKKLLIIFNQHCIEYIFRFLAPVYKNRYHNDFIEEAPYLIKASRKKSKTEILQQKDGFLKSIDKNRIAKIELEYSGQTYILTSHKVPIGSNENNNAKLEVM